MATVSASYGEETDRGSVSKNTLCFDLIDKDTTFQDRITFGRRVLFDILNIQPEEIYCLQQSTAKKYYDVTLITTERAEDMRRKANITTNEDLKRYAVTPLYRRDYRILTVHMYNPWVSEETIRCFLGRHVKRVTRCKNNKRWTGHMDG